MDIKRELRAGAESARIGTHRSALLRALQVGVPLGIAIGVPVAWWGKVLIFMLLAFLVGFVVQFREIRRGRRLGREAQ